MSAHPRLPLDRLTLSYPVSLASYAEYAQAERAVGTLAGRGFPVQHCLIVGTDLRHLERVTGRLDIGRIMVRGAGGGAWLGILIGLIMSMASPTGPEWSMFVFGAAAGGLFGIVWGLLGYAVTRGRREFTAVSEIVAGRYELFVEHQLADQARQALSGRPLPPPPGGPGPAGPGGPGSAGPGGPGSAGPGAPDGMTPAGPQGATAVARPDPGTPAEPDQQLSETGAGASARPAYQPQFRTYGEAMDARRRAAEGAETAEAATPTELDRGPGDPDQGTEAPA